MSSEREHDDAPGDEPRVLAGLDHAGEVVQGGIDVAPAHRLDERTDHVVVLVAVAVVAQQRPVDGPGDDIGGDRRLRGCRGIRPLVVAGRRGIRRRRRFRLRRHGLGRRDRRRLECGERAARVARREPDDRGPRLGLELDPAGEAARVFDGAVDQHAEVVVGEEFEREQQRSRQERRDDRERRVLGRGGDQDDPAVLDTGQQRVLLGLREPVDLVEEEHRGESVEVAARSCLLHDLRARRARRRSRRRARRTCDPTTVRSPARAWSCRCRAGPRG